ncbi:MAG: SsrA-binding protein SmpB [Burkholderiaceae bacterium]|mgnify:FL=1|nr:SsrA-binding protein SmpB [Burkholderiaceae bacterium]MDP3424363.1 SsrA-binding protein SmpB [Burkholderiaceae bacterium]MDZ4163411.1 SsrA-binding protein SmpB [Burkholderiales bacterium]
MNTPKPTSPAPGAPKSRFERKANAAAAKAPPVRIADNKKALFNYHIEDRYEAGMVLQGWEVKAVRLGKVQLTDGYVVVRDGELYLIGCQINPIRSTSTHVTAEAARTKKLLLNKDEIRRLIGKVEQKGFTLVPLNLHWKNGRVKCDIALAKGKAEHDKRDTVKEREGKREVERTLKIHRS